MRYADLKIPAPTRLFRVLSLFLFPVFAACGGGGGSGFAPPPPPPPPGSGWQPGVFLDASTFQNLCQNPRSGIDPATNQPFVDLQGTTLDENNFLRSHSDDTYLWYSEIVDQDPALFNDPLVYFDQLVTNATTPSGQLKDKFHFSIPTAEFFQLAQSGVVAGYGITWALLSATPPREAVIAYTEPNSPATNLPIPLARGARVLTIDGVDVATGADVDTLNAGLFPVGVGELHEFEILDLGSNTPRIVQLTSAEVTTSPVQNVSFVDTPTGDRIGYMLFNDHILTAEDALVSAVNQLNNFGIDDLVLDIRYNGGGFLFLASQLAYMIGGPQATAGQPFETLQFNDKHPVTNPVTGEALQPTPFYNGTTTNQPLPVLNLPVRRVYVLTGPGTCSASESIMNSLRGVDVEVIQIGSTTCGKPYGFYEAPNCGTSYFTIQFRGVNAKNFGDYTDGFSPANTASGILGTLVPGCSVADDFFAQLGDPLEARFAAALGYRATGNCPAATGVAGPGLNKLGAQPALRDGVVVKNPWLMNRTLGRP